jgi:RNA polymerase sigma factor, sigma-70 family
MDIEYFKQNILPLKNKLFRKALSITESVEEAEDVVQEVMMRIWDKRTEWSNITNMEVYSMVSVKNMALDKIKRIAYRSESVDTDTVKAIVSDLLHPQDEMEKTEKITLLWDVIRRLPDKLQSLVRMREIEEYSYREIAEEMNLTEAQVKINLFRARQKMKEIYLQLNTYEG